MPEVRVDKVLEIAKRNRLPFHEHADQLGDLVRVETLVPGPSNQEQAKAICRYFGMSDVFPQEHGREYFWDLLQEIRQTVFRSLQLSTGEEWRVDWSREDGAFCLWYRHRDHRRDATRDLSFVRKHTLMTLKHVKIEESSEHGFGVFAIDQIKKGEVLGFLDGQLLTVDEYDLLHVNIGSYMGRLRGHFFMEWNAIDHTHLLARAYRTAYSYINHSDDPNLAIFQEDGSHRLIVKSLHCIDPNVECFLDYRKEPLPRGYFESRAANYLRPRPVLE